MFFFFFFFFIQFNVPFKIISLIETSQLGRWGETGVPRENHLTHPQAELGLQGQLLEGVECHIYLYCFTFDDINLNRALVIIVLFPTKYSNKKVCANDIRKCKAL